MKVFSSYMKKKETNVRRIRQNYNQWFPGSKDFIMIYVCNMNLFECIFIGH